MVSEVYPWSERLTRDWTNVRERGRYARFVAPYDDDDDWVGTPPEGRYTRDRANPEFWRNQRPLSFAAAGLVVVVIIVVVIVITR